jgi:hypothetical protein
MTEQTGVQKCCPKSTVKQEMVFDSVTALSPHVCHTFSIAVLIPTHVHRWQHHALV